MKKIRTFSFFILSTSFFLMNFVKAAGLVPEGEEPLGWCQFFAMIQRIINFLLYYISLPFAILAFVYAGFLFMFSGGNTGDIEKAENIFKQVVTGLFIAFAAWVLINFIINWLAPNFSNVAGSSWFNLKCD